MLAVEEHIDMYQEGYVHICKCTGCGEQFPAFIFEAETDMLTYGCVSLTGLDKSILLTEQRPEETCDQVELRTGQNFKTLAVRYVTNNVPAGLCFQESRRIYKAPTPIYSCIYCGTDANVIKEETKQQFLKHGKINVL